MRRHTIMLVAIFTALVGGQLAMAQPELPQRGADIGINGAACAFSDIASAIQAASSGDTIYVAPGFRAGFIGKIDKSLTFLPSQAASPGFSGCEQEMTSAESDTVIFDAKSFSDDATGGLSEIQSGATVTFRHMWFRTASATNGGIFAVTGGSTLILQDVLVTGGVATGSGGLIYVEGTAGNPSRLTLSDDTELYSGNAGTGGGVALVNGTLVISNAFIGVNNSQFNTATGNGGGIHALDSFLDLDILPHIFNNVSGNHGGGIYAENTLIDMDFGRIDDNQSEFSGGGVFLHNSTLITDSTRFETNTNNNQQANSGGGAVYAENNSVMTIRSSDFNLNTGHLGGAIHVRSGSSLDMSNGSTVSGNFATQGGGIHVESTAVLDDVTINNNLSANNGGGIQCLGCTSLNITMSQITDNAADSGGGLYVSDSDTMVDIVSTTFNLNRATSTLEDEGIGGGLYMAGGLLTISNSVINQNSAALQGGGLYLMTTATNSQMVSIVNTGITSNTTTENGSSTGGAGMYVRESDLMLTDALFQLNHTRGIGGGALVVFVSTADIANTLFDQNVAEGFGGGAIYASNSTLEIHSQSSFTNNDGDAFGGALRLIGGACSIRDATIDNNNARFGGGIQSQSTELEVVNSRLINNTGAFGGGLYASRGDITFRAETGTSPGACDPTQLASNEYCMEVSGNSATTEGGGVHLNASSGRYQGTFSQVAFQNNQAEANGSAMFLSASNPSTVEVTNALVAGNGNLTDESSVIESIGEVNLLIDSSTVAGNFGSPLWVADIISVPTLTNSILYENSVGPNVITGVTFTRSCNNAQSVENGSQSMNGNLGDPMFTTTTRGDYRLPVSSVSVNQCLNGPVRDLDGLFRPDASGLYDQGAFELEGLATLPDNLFEDGFED